MSNETMRTVVVDGVGVEMELRDAQVIERAFRKMEDQLRDLSDQLAARDEEMSAKEAEVESEQEEKEEMKKKGKEEMEKKDAIIVAKDSEIEDLKKQLADAEMTPDKLDALVDARSAVVDHARAILGDAKADFKGKTLNDVRRVVVDKKLGDKAKGWSDAQVEAVFDSFDEAKPSAPHNANGFADAVTAFSKPFSAADADNNRAMVYDKYDEEISNAWNKTAQ